MTFTRAKPGGWQIGERLTSSQANHIDVALPDAIDGGAGGSYDPSSPIVIGGSGLRVGAPTVNGMPARKEEIDTKATAGSARYGIVAGGASPLVLSEELSSTGFSLENGGTQIKVPAAGRYLVAWCVMPKSSDNNATLIMRGRVGGVGQAEIILYMYGVSGPVQGCQTFVVEVTDPETDLIDFTMTATSGTPTVEEAIDSSLMNKVSVVRISP